MFRSVMGISAPKGGFVITRSIVPSSASFFASARPVRYVQRNDLSRLISEGADELPFVAAHVGKPTQRLHDCWVELSQIDTALVAEICFGSCSRDRQPRLVERRDQRDPLGLIATDLVGVIIAATGAGLGVLGKP